MSKLVNKWTFLMIFLTCVAVVIFMYFYEVNNLCAVNNTYGFQCYQTFNNAYTLILSFTLLSLPLLLTLPFNKIVFLKWFKFASVAVPLQLIYIYDATTNASTDWFGINYKMVLACFVYLAYILISLGIITYIAYGVKRGKISTEDDLIEKSVLVKRLKRKVPIWFSAAMLFLVANIVIPGMVLCSTTGNDNYGCISFTAGLSDVALLVMVLLLPLVLSFHLRDVTYMYLYRFTLYSALLVVPYGIFVVDSFNWNDNHYYDSDHQYWYLITVVLIYYFAFLLIYFSKKKSEQAN